MSGVIMFKMLAVFDAPWVQWQPHGFARKRKTKQAKALRIRRRKESEKVRLAQSPEPQVTEPVQNPTGTGPAPLISSYIIP